MSGINTIPFKAIGNLRKLELHSCRHETVSRIRKLLVTWSETVLEDSEKDCLVKNISDRLRLCIERDDTLLLRINQGSGLRPVIILRRTGQFDTYAK